jgi:hypothetical protein
MEKENLKRNTPDINEKLMMEMMVDGVQKDGLQSPVKVPDIAEPALEKAAQKSKGKLKKASDSGI